MRKLTVSCRLLISNFYYDDYTRLFADMADFLDVSRWQLSYNFRVTSERGRESLRQARIKLYREEVNVENPRQKLRRSRSNGI